MREPTSFIENNPAYKLKAG